MKVLFATSESAPFARTGGLGDVASALPKALKKIGTDVRVIMPLYKNIPQSFKSSMEFIGSVYVPLGWRNQYAGLFSIKHDDVVYYFIDNEYYFNRNGMYGHFDDGERFSFFSKAILEVLPMIGFCPNIIHLNDWQTGLVPVYLDEYYRNLDFYRFVKTVVTIHNIEFQGEMDKFVIRDVFGVGDDFYDVVEYKGNANMLKAGIERSNIVTTVSQTYAGEILNKTFAYGLETILNQRKYKIKGIVNGIDTEVYDPLKDKSLFQKFSIKSIARKAKNKEKLRDLLSLPQNNAPVIGMVTRLTSQKGLNMMLSVMEDILSMNLQLVILGTGEWRYENALKDLKFKYPDKLSILLEFNADIASKIYGASDMFLMPSVYEPCGLSQLIAMRYGSIPIVRETGGLKDTVPPFNHTDLTGKGFTFQSLDAYDLLDAIKRAVGAYGNKKEWTALMKNAMNGDYSWENSAKEYLSIYNELING